MFTGIIHCVAQLIEQRSENKNLHLSFRSPLSSELHINQSVSHNGTCLSVTAQRFDTHCVIAVDQTLGTTNLGNLQTGDLVNLELARPMDQRLEGHYVQGHVDRLLRCLSYKERSGSWTFIFDLPVKYRPYLIEKGSICINGISLTAHDVHKDRFSVSIIPYTYEQTNFSRLQIGDLVNVEFDIVGKYLYRFFSLSHPSAQQQDVSEIPPQASGL